MDFSQLGLRPELQRAIERAGYTTPTPIQAQAIPAALTGEDVLGCARTGTGKTAAFLLPLLHRLAAGKRAGVRALIVTPTRELAAQIGEQAGIYGQFLPLKSAVIFGGVGLGPQTDKLRRGVDLVIATPGRLLDHMGQGHVHFNDLETLVLDEADRMLDMGFLPDVRRILRALPTQRQNLFFSATMPAEIEDLIKRTMRHPKVVEVTPRATTAEAVRQVLYPVEGTRKPDLLRHLLEAGDMHHVLVFTRTKARANRLTKQLLATTDRRAAAIHGNKSQAARTRALDGFRDGSIDVLVATDIAARGIDVDDISHVVNFDLPHVPEDYVHRIGRTARAGASGDAISLAAPDEASQVAAIERLIGTRIPRLEVTGFKLSPSTAVDGDRPERSRGHRPGRPVAHHDGSAPRRTRPGRPAAGRPAAGRPAAGRPAAGRPAAGRPASSRPPGVRPAAGRPATGGASTAAPSRRRRRPAAPARS